MAIPTISLFKLNYLGDAVTFLPTVQGIRRIFPDASLMMVCNKATASIYSRTFPKIVTIGLDRQRVNGIRGLINLPRILWHLGVRTCDYGLLSHDEPALSYLAALFSLSKQRIGFELTGHSFRHTLTKTLPAENGRNIVDLNFDLVRFLTGDMSLCPERTPIGYTKDDAAVVTAKLRNTGIEDGTPFVLIHPLAKRIYQQWGLHKYKDLSRRIEKTGLKTVFLSECHENNFMDVARISDMTHPQLSRLCEKARLFVGSNSGPLHVAAAMGTSTLSIQGPTSREWNVYWTDVPHKRIAADSVGCAPCERLGHVTWDCTNEARPMECMAEISVEEVYLAAMDLLS